MIFDSLVGMIERTSSDHLKTLGNDAHLFHFPINSRDGTLSQDLTDEQFRFLVEEFFLPFPVTAVEDNESCVIITAMEKERFGINQPWMCVEYIPPGTIGDILPEYKGVGMINMGIITRFEPQANKRTMAASLPSFVMLLVNHSEREIVAECRIEADDASDNAMQCRKMAFRNWKTAIEELLLMNQPSRFILETSPLKPRAHPKKILRSHERPIYTLLHPKEIRERMHLPEHIVESHSSPVPHERRAHTRTLRSERYKAAKGRVIFVPATWVGPHETTHEHRRYRVLLDK